MHLFSEYPLLKNAHFGSEMTFVLRIRNKQIQHKGEHIKIDLIREDFLQCEIVPWVMWHHRARQTEKITHTRRFLANDATREEINYA